MSNRGQAVTLMVRIAGEDAGASRLFKGARTEVRGLNSELRDTKVQVGSAFAAYGGYTQLQDAAQAAASLNEAQATTGQVFTATERMIRAYGEGAAESIGLSERAALEASNQYGALLQNLGLTEQEAARWSTTLVGLGSDLSAAWDKPVDQALTALRSGLAGEMEPLKQFGIVLTDSRLRQEALNQGIYDGTGILSANQRAQAALALIMDDSAKAQGQYAREADGLRQKQQAATAEAENARAAFGQGLLPIFKAVADGIRLVAGAYNDLPPVGQKVVSGTAAVVTGLAGLSFAAGTAWPAVTKGYGLLGRLGQAARLSGMNLIVPKRSIEGLGTSMTSTSTKASGLTGSIKSMGAGGPIAAVGLGVLLLTLNQMAVASERSKRNVADLRAGLEEGMTPLETMAEKLARTFSGSEGGFEGIEGKAEKLKATLDDVGVSTPDLAQALTGSDADWAALEEKIRAALDIDEDVAGGLVSGQINYFSDEAEQYATAIRNLREWRGEGNESTQQFEAYKAEMRANGFVIDDTTGAIVEQTEALGDQRSAYERSKEAIERSLTRSREIASAQDAVAAAHRDTEEAQLDLALAQRAALGDSDEYSDALEGIADAVDGVRDAEEQVADAQRGVADAQRELNDEREAARDRLREMAQAARDSVLAEDEANLAVERARQELERVRRSGGSDLDRREAELELRKAEEEARQAAEDRKAIESDNQRAQAAGVEGDAGVVRARQAVAEANRQVTDAEEALAEARTAVGEAERRAAKVIADARARVIEAQKAAEEAVIDEAAAWGELATKQNGSIIGAQRYREVLADLAADLDPASPLAQRIATLIADIDRALSIGRALQNPNVPIAQDPRATGRSNARTGDGGRGGNGGDDGGVAGNGVIVNQTNNVVVQGTPEGQRRAFRQEADRLADETARAVSR